MGRRTFIFICSFGGLSFKTSALVTPVSWWGMFI